MSDEKKSTLETNESKRIKCSECGNMIEDLTQLRCPRCYSALYKSGCTGACRKCTQSAGCKGS